MPRNMKRTTLEVADIVDNEGLDYAILHYMGAENIEDPQLAKLWEEASEALAAIDQILEDARVNAQSEDEEE